MACSREHSWEDDVDDLDSSFSELWIKGTYKCCFFALLADALDI